MRVLAVSLVALTLVAAPALADYMADYTAAEADGFEAVEWSTEYDDMAAWLDREVVSDWMNARAPGAAYSISYAGADLDKDGFGDALVLISTAADLVPDGSPVLVIMKQGRGWQIVDATHAVDVAVRGDGAVAYLDITSYRTWRP